MTVRSRSFQDGHTTFLAALDRSKWSMQKVFCIHTISTLQGETYLHAAICGQGLKEAQGEK
jgi:hypothetical protein